MPDNIFTGAELERVLSGGQALPQQEEGTLIGLVKPSDREEHVALSLAGCEDWIDFPSKMIEKAEQIGESKCHDHSHPVFKIQVKTPSDPMAKALLALVAKVTGIAAQPDQPMVGGDMSGTMARGIGMGGFGGFGSTLPTCRYVKRMVVCGSALPGYPVPMCPEILYCCRWPNGSEGCM